MIDLDLYTQRPADESERQQREQHPRHLATRLMSCDILKY